MTAYNLFNFIEKIVMRLPKLLHREMVEAADRDGVSLNAFVNVALAKSVGEKHTIGGMISISGGTLPVNELVSHNV